MSSLSNVEVSRKKLSLVKYRKFNRFYENILIWSQLWASSVALDRHGIYWAFHHSIPIEEGLFKKPLHFPRCWLIAWASCGLICLAHDTIWTSSCCNRVPAFTHVSLGFGRFNPLKSASLPPNSVRPCIFMFVCVSVLVSSSSGWMRVQHHTHTRTVECTEHQTLFAMPD